MNEKSRQVAYTNVTQEDYVMAEPEVTPHPVVEVPCGIQFCSSRHPFAAMEAPKAWWCGAHRWPGGQDDPSIEVVAMGAPATFVNGVEYAVSFDHEHSSGRISLSGRIVGRFDMSLSGGGRLRFTSSISTWVLVDPDDITHVVAL